VTRRGAGAVAPLAMALALASCGSSDPSSPSPIGDAQWTAPVAVLRDTVSTTAAPRIAAGGRQVAVIRDWEPTDALRVARLGADGRWLPPERVPTLTPSTAHIGADSLGRMVLAWTAYHPDFAGFWCVWASNRAATAAWSTPRTLACNAGQSRLAVGASGHALVAWTWSRYEGLAGAHYDPATGSWETDGFANSDRYIESFDAAVDADGLAAVTWYEDSGGTGAVQLALSRNGRTLYNSALRDDLSSPREPRVAFESAGTAVLAWDGGIERGIEAATISPTGGVIAGVTGDPNDSCPDVAGSGHGTALMSWSRRAADPGVFAAMHVEGSLWAPEQVQPAQLLLPRCPVLAMDTQGNTVAAWSLAGPTGFDFEIWASFRPAASGRWTATRRLATDAADPAVAIADGVAYVVWRALSGDLIQESRLRFAP
jgi:hypothetical protein